MKDPHGIGVKGPCERDWREHEEFFSRKISIPLNPDTVRVFALSL